MAPGIIHRLATFGFLSTILASPIEKRQAVRRAINYSGIAIQGAPDGTPFNYVSTQINIPDPIYVNSESSPGQVQTAAAWVGFGGADPNTNGINQIGCSASV